MFRDHVVFSLFTRLKRVSKTNVAEKVRLRIYRSRFNFRLYEKLRSRGLLCSLGMTKTHVFNTDWINVYCDEKLINLRLIKHFQLAQLFLSDAVRLKKIVCGWVCMLWVGDFRQKMVVWMHISKYKCWFGLCCKHGFWSFLESFALVDYYALSEWSKPKFSTQTESTYNVCTQWDSPLATVRTVGSMWRGAMLYHVHREWGCWP